MDTQRAVLIIQDYIRDLKLPVLGYGVRRGPGRMPLKHKRFEEMSYWKWAAVEIIRYVQEQESVPPIMAIQEFAEKMNKYSSANSATSFVFSVAHDVAMDILDIFLAMGETYPGYLDL